MLLRGAACCCVLLRVAACCCVLLRAAACCCVLLRGAASGMIFDMPVYDHVWVHILGKGNGSKSNLLCINTVPHHLLFLKHAGRTMK